MPKHLQRDHGTTKPSPSKLRRNLLLVASLSALSACASIRPGRPDPVRAEVEELFRQFELGLRHGSWSSVSDYFSDDPHGTLADIRERIDDRKRREFAADWLLRVNQILAQDKQISVSVRWLHRWNDLKGKPHKRDGTSEFILRRDKNKQLRIVDIRGNML